jgi:hypothetical protein
VQRPAQLWQLSVCLTVIPIDHTFIEVGQHGAAVCDPTQEIADQPEAPTSTLVREADFNETRCVMLDELSVGPIPQTPSPGAPVHHINYG